MNARKPSWLKIKLKDASKLIEVKKMLDRLSLHTVCEEANCPNVIECFGRKTATFMILGRICTRNCTFCNVGKGEVEEVDFEEPYRVASAVQELNLKHVVITSVTRDDLSDGGADHFVRVIEKIRELENKVTIEVLIPDFQGDGDALLKVIKGRPDILNHNIETVPRLYSSVRPQANYLRSLKLLENAKQIDDAIYTKSGIMLGLGEKEEEVVNVMKDLRNIGCDVLTIGQYLAPSKNHHPVIEYIEPVIFEKYKEIGYELGFKYVASGPLVRSSYHADEFFT
ncbi:MAG: lipoyl synthase [Peptococcaceae bacterium BICA1-8]|nr:MAG: lipoyl synthase [Peptococcaceae bacterium BICA1-8]